MGAGRVEFLVVVYPRLRLFLDLDLSNFSLDDPGPFTDNPGRHNAWAGPGACFGEVDMSESKDVREQLRRPISAELYDEIRDLWKTHSIAEDRRDLDGLISTLTEDCVYEIVDQQSGAVLHAWNGHDGAREFYRSLLGAFPDVQFDLQNIVIGPQGIFEEAILRGTWTEAWLGREPSGEAIETRVLILFPWDEEARLFSGERIYAGPIGT